MRPLVLFLLLPALFAPCFGQKMTVFKTKGKVVNETTRQTLRSGSQFKKNDQLDFSNPADRLAVYDERKIVLIVSPRQSGKTVTTHFRPIPYKSAGRQGKILNPLDLINHLAGDTAYLILGGESKIEIASPVLPMNDDTFFYVSYTYDGITINKKLPHRGDTLILSESELFQAKFDKSELPSGKGSGDTLVQLDPAKAIDFEMRYFDYRNQGHILVFDREAVAFQPVFLRSDEVKEQVEFMVSVLKTEAPDLTAEQWLNRIHAYLEEAFAGKMDKANLEAWMQQEKVAWR